MKRNYPKQNNKMKVDEKIEKIENTLIINTNKHTDISWKHTRSIPSISQHWSAMPWQEKLSYCLV